MAIETNSYTSDAQRKKYHCPHLPYLYGRFYHPTCRQNKLQVYHFRCYNTLLRQRSAYVYIVRTCTVYGSWIGYMEGMVRLYNNAACRKCNLLKYATEFQDRYVVVCTNIWVSVCFWKKKCVLFNSWNSISIWVYVWCAPSTLKVVWCGDSAMDRSWIPQSSFI